MYEPNIREIPYGKDSEYLFSRIRDLPHAVFLDSGRQRLPHARFDILVADPSEILSGKIGEQSVFFRGQETGVERVPDACLFDILRALLKEIAPEKPCQNSLHLPFQGGAIGFFSYDFARRLLHCPAWIKHHQENLKVAPSGPERSANFSDSMRSLPDFWLGIYPWALVIDHMQKASYLVIGKKYPEHKRKLLWQRICNDPPEGYKESKPFCVTSTMQYNMSSTQYTQKFDAIQDYIRRGECYQVNFSQCFGCLVEGCIWEAYRRLRRINAASYSAFIDIGEYQILSISPELFLRVRGREVETRPIKGTAARKSGAEDIKQKEALHRSTKNRAENLMIVDLLRNDLGKTCIPGTVHVAELFSVISLANVHHLVSVVKGRLSDGMDCLDLLAGCFPGGSISGAPKRRAMQIIAKLEPDRRGIYCGSLGYISACGNMEMNIAIRTLVHKVSGMAFFSGGGGIVYDSKCDEEYQETLDKVSSFFQVFS